MVKRLQMVGEKPAGGLQEEHSGFESALKAAKSRSQSTFAALSQNQHALKSYMKDLIPR